MDEMMEHSFLLTFDEVRILLYGMGIRTVEGVYMPEKTFGRRQVLGALQHLVKGGLITAGDQGFQIRPKLQEILKIMGNPAGTWIWSPGEAKEVLEAETLESGKPEYFCYAVPGWVAVSEQCWRKKETLRVRLFTAEAFEAWKEKLEQERGDER